ncbi:hypothetical protein EB796_004425 [Bugula neritina]|uniref:Uncharacterized protein n=1 Tax=Bugula neritina TaxID=10212 RepID=A0A7J7KGC7_BUGNE|nr:hypothetical protein EB796_004425 [Bugula neritina]
MFSAWLAIGYLVRRAHHLEDKKSYASTAAVTAATYTTTTSEPPPPYQRYSEEIFEELFQHLNTSLLSIYR